MNNDKILKSIAETYKKMKQEELKGDQHKIDANKNGEIDAHDFKLLRAKNEETEPKSEKEKNLAALGHPKDKITHKDVLIGRGVLKKEGWDSKKPAVSEQEDSVNEISFGMATRYATKRGAQDTTNFPKAQSGVELAVKKIQGKPGVVPTNNSYVPEEKEDAPFAGPYSKTPKKQEGQKNNPSMSRARHLARQAMQNLAQKKKDKKVAEQFVLEGKMGQLHADIGDHLDKHIKDYNAGNLGHDSFGEKVVAAHKKIADLHGISQDAAKKHVNDYVDQHMKEEFELNEATKSGDDSLHDWFSKSKSSDGKPGWVQIGGKYAGKPCAKQPGQTTKPKCGSSKMKRDLSKDEEDAAFRRKNEKDPNPERSGKAKMVATEEKDACYHKVKARYKIWPSAYASGALVKCRKVGADNWGNKSEEFDLSEQEELDERNMENKKKKNEYVASIIQKKLHPSVLPSLAYGRRELKKEEVELNEGNDDVGEMIKDKLKIIINRAKEMHDGIGPNTDMPEWVKSKITLAQDYVSTACDYSCGSEQLGEEVNEGLVGSIAKGVAIDVLGNMAFKALTKKGDKKEKDQVDERCWSGYKPVQGKDAYSKGSCKKEEVELDEAMNVSSDNQGTFKHAETKKYFTYKNTNDPWAKKHGLPHEIHVGPNAKDTRFGHVKGSVAHVAVDERSDGGPEIEKWKITNHERKINEDMETPDIKVRKTYTDAYADHYKRALKLNPKGASKRAEAMAYDTVKMKHGDDAHDTLKAYHNKNQNESYEQIHEDLSSRAKLVKELYNKAKEEKKSKKDKFDPDPEMEIMPSPQYAQPKK